MRLLITLSSAFILAISQLAVASAQDATLMTPQDEHKLLKRFAGEWEFERRSVPQEGAEPQSLGKGTVSAEMVGEFFVVSRWSGELYGIEYIASQSLGYDVEQKKYTGSWIDSFMSHRWELSGTVDEASQEFTITTSGPSPTGGTTQFRERYEFHSEESITIIGEMQRDEQWVKISATHLSRKE